MEKQKFERLIRKINFFLEAIIAIIIVIAIIIGMVDLVKYIFMIFTTNPIDTYDVFQKFLGHALLLVVGVELVSMLTLHTPVFIIDVLLFAIARKLLIGSQSMTDYILGILSIAGIFFIKRFLILHNSNLNDKESKQ